MSEALDSRHGTASEFVTRPIVIAGAGIAGLTAAIALQRGGWRTLVLERAAAPHELGAGLQLGPNAVRVLTRLGLGPCLLRLALRPRSVEIRDAGTARLLSRMPLAGAFEARYGAPYCVLARPALHRLLTEAAIGAGAELHYASDVEGYTIQADGVVVHARGTAPLTGAGLVGADGLWSLVRSRLVPTGAPRRTRMTALRATIAPGAARIDGVPAAAITAWLARRLHAVTYRIDAAGTLNLVVVTEATTRTEGWEVPADAAALGDVAAKLARPLAEAVDAARDWSAWPLLDGRAATGPLAGAVTLVGDAAHPMLPFIAQGAGMAIEDGYALAEAVAAVPHDLTGAFRSYEHARRRRTSRVAAAARRNGRAFHLPGTLARARDFMLAALPDEAMMKRYDWLYGGGPAPIPGRAHSGAR